jgi:uncharacterized protein
MIDKWKLYDDLIAAVPDNLVVAESLAGLSWFLVRSAGTGVSMRPPEVEDEVRGAGSIAGMKVKDLAARIKSWNSCEAALGLAAINSALNARDRVLANCGAEFAEETSEGLFTHVTDELRGKRVAVVGHFPKLDRLAQICDLSILERRPKSGDLPDPACEYILGEQDVVIITATTLINKTMPRLLELSRGARVFVAGPSTPLHPVMFHHGIELLGGLIIEDQSAVWRSVAEGGHKALFAAGSRMVNIAQSAKSPGP